MDSILELVLKTEIHFHLMEDKFSKLVLEQPVGNLLQILKIYLNQDISQIYKIGLDSFKLKSRKCANLKFLIILTNSVKMLKKSSK